MQVFYCAYFITYVNPFAILPFSDIKDANERRDAEIEFYKELHEKMYKVALVSVTDFSHSS